MTLTVCTGGTVLVGITVDGAPELSSAIAFDHTGVVALGADAEALREQADEMIDLKGGTLAPAPGDGHAHPVLGALEAAGPAVRQAEDLAGIVTDGDLRRNLDGLLGKRVDEVMTRTPRTIPSTALASEALGVMNGAKITSLFVTRPEAPRRPVGILHVHDCLRAGVG